MRDGAAISSATIPRAVEGSLRRLQTDHIDLYQFHWPNRGSYMFRQNWRYDPSGQERATTLAHVEDALEALQRQVEKGNIGHFGLYFVHFCTEAQVDPVRYMCVSIIIRIELVAHGKVPVIDIITRVPIGTEGMMGILLAWGGGIAQAMTGA